MPILSQYGVFISHSWKYSAGYNRVVSMLRDASNFKWNNYSVPIHNPKEGTSDRALENALINQIKPTNVVIILSGMYVNHSKWIQKEIDIAKRFGKPIIGIRPRGNTLTPQAVQNAAIQIVGWNTDSIVSAIRSHSK